MKGGGLAILAVASLLAPDVLASCAGPMYAERYTLDPDEQAVDTTAPGPVSVILVKVKRYEATEEQASGCTDVSDGNCWVFASVAVTISAQDDRTPEESIGYRLELVRGELPEDSGMLADQTEPGIPDVPVRPGLGGETLLLNWWDHRDDKTRPIDFAFTIRAVDQAGNEGPATEPIEVYHPGFSEGGCAVDGGAPGLFGWLVAASLLIAIRRRFYGAGRES